MRFEKDTKTKKPYKRYEKRREYTPREPITIEHQVDILEAKVAHYGIFKFFKHKVAGRKYDELIRLADERGINLIEEDETSLIFGR